MKYTDKLRYYADKLDQVKWNIFNEDECAFCLAILNKDGTNRHIGIGNGEEMSELILLQIRNMYRGAADRTTPERFAESVKQSFLRYLEAFPGDNDEGSICNIRFNEGDGCS